MIPTSVDVERRRRRRRRLDRFVVVTGCTVAVLTFVVLCFMQLGPGHVPSDAPARDALVVDATGHGSCGHHAYRVEWREGADVEHGTLPGCEKTLRVGEHVTVYANARHDVTTRTAAQRWRSFALGVGACVLIALVAILSVALPTVLHRRLRRSVTRRLERAGFVDPGTR